MLGNESFYYSQQARNMIKSQVYLSIAFEQSASFRDLTFLCITDIG